MSVSHIPPISDGLWAKVQPLVPPPRREPGRRYRRRPGSGRKPIPPRKIFEAIVHVLRTGTPWKSLPKSQCGSPSAVHRYFGQWQEAGLFHAIWQHGLAQHPDLCGISWQGRIPDQEEERASPGRRQRPAHAPVRWEPARPVRSGVGGAATDDIPTGRGKWGKSCEVLRLHILNGTYGRGALLPSQKVLVHRYGVSYPTLRKCLDLLEGEGLLTPHKRGYLSPTFGPGAPGSRLMLMWLGSPPDERTGPAPFDELEEMFIRFLESEALKAGVIVDTMTFYPEDDGRVRYFRRESLQPCVPQNDPDIIGFVVMQVAPSTAFADVAAALKPFGKPVAVVDQIGDQATQEAVRRSPGFRVFTTRGGMRPGRDVGRFLLSLGHRRVAYLSPYHDDSWSQLRLQGLAREYLRAGMQDGVRPFVIADRGHDPDAGGVWIPMREGARRFGLPAFLESMDHWLEGAPRSFARKVNSYFRTWIQVNCGVEEASLAMRPLLEEALNRRDITAWVASGDVVAQYVLDFLTEKGVSVPGGISLISFDNSLRALRQGITSYSFGESALAASVLNHILRPEEFGEAQRRHVVQIPGIVVERATTARMRASG